MCTKNSIVEIISICASICVIWCDFTLLHFRPLPFPSLSIHVTSHSKAVPEHQTAMFFLCHPHRATCNSQYYSLRLGGGMRNKPFHQLFTLKGPRHFLWSTTNTLLSEMDEHRSCIFFRCWWSTYLKCWHPYLHYSQR